MGHFGQTLVWGNDQTWIYTVQARDWVATPRKSMCLCKTNSKYHAKLLLQDVILFFHVMLCYVFFVCVNYVCC